MIPTITPRAQTSQPSRNTAAFRAAFRAHLGVSQIRVATGKTLPSEKVSPSHMGSYPFFTPPDCLCAALVVDVDRPFASLEIFDALPAEIYPSWVVETPKGAQAGWMIETVDLRPTARTKPIAYARAVGAALRAAVDGDLAVDPVSASRVRNPAFEGVHPIAAATPPVYSLGALHEGLKGAGLWNPTIFPAKNRAGGGATAAAASAVTGVASRVGSGVIGVGTRNSAVFDACRFTAYAGGDYEASAWEANDRCQTPLPVAEVTGIIASVTRFMTRNGTGSGASGPGVSGAGSSRSAGSVSMPGVMRELLVEMGRRGGLANTAAQRAARALGPAASAAASRAATDARAAHAQRLRARGHSAAVICARLRAGRATVYRWLRRYVAHGRRGVSPMEHQVFSGRPCVPYLWGRRHQRPYGSSPGTVWPSGACRSDPPPGSTPGAG